METTAGLFQKFLARKLAGGVTLTVHVSSRIWLGGMLESEDHQPFVALGPSDWESEEELTFFKDRAQVRDLTRRLEAAANAAWPEEPA